MINGREGMRRVGLLFGVLGAMAGCIFSAVVGNELLDRRSLAKTFESLASIARAVAMSAWVDVTEHPAQKDTRKLTPESFMASQSSQPQPSRGSVSTPTLTVTLLRRHQILSQRTARWFPVPTCPR
jgi:hypothetical protein